MDITITLKTVDEDENEVIKKIMLVEGRINFVYKDDEKGMKVYIESEGYAVNESLVKIKEK